MNCGTDWSTIGMFIGIGAISLIAIISVLFTSIYLTKFFSSNTVGIAVKNRVKKAKPKNSNDSLVAVLSFLIIVLVAIGVAITVIR